MIYIVHMLQLYMVYRDMVYNDFYCTYVATAYGFLLHIFATRDLYCIHMLQLYMVYNDFYCTYVATAYGL